MQVSLIVSLLVLGAKTFAYFLTNSAAILSDSVESIVHIVAVGFATYSMWLSQKPPDEKHLYGHEKIGFFSAGFEGAMIIFAALFIIYESISKWIRGYQLENIEAGLGLTIAVIFINFILAFYLIGKGKRYKSIVLEANGKHILTDCWTSCGVIIAFGLVKWTGKLFFDPLIAILTALNILWTGSNLVKRSFSGLMDEADPRLHSKIVEILSEETKKRGLIFHHLRHRKTGKTVFIEFHLLFPSTTLEEAHESASEIESVLKKSLDQPADIFTHLEPKKSHDSTHKRYGLGH